MMREAMNLLDQILRILRLGPTVFATFVLYGISSWPCARAPERTNPGYVVGGRDLFRFWLYPIISILVFKE